MPNTKDKSTKAEIEVPKTEIEEAKANETVKNFESRLGNLEALINSLTKKNEELEAENKQLKAQVDTETARDEALEEANAYMNEKVPVKLFKGQGKYREDKTVIYNGEAYIIKRGVTVMVPRAVAAILRQSEEKDNETDDMIEKLEEEFEAKTKEVYGG